MASSALQGLAPAPLSASVAPFVHINLLEGYRPSRACVYARVCVHACMHMHHDCALAECPPFCSKTAVCFLNEGRALCHLYQ